MEGEFAEGKEGYFRVVAKKLGYFTDINRQSMLQQYLGFAESQIFVYRKLAAVYSKYLAEWVDEQ